MDVLTVSLGRNILREGRERERMHSYARHLNSLSIIVLTRKEHGYTEVVHEGNLHVYPTHTRTRIGMLTRAFQIGRSIAKTKEKRGLTISAQDPLEIGWLCFFLAKVMGAQFHVQVHGDYFSSEAWVGRSPIRRMKRFCARILLGRAPAIRVVSERIKTSLVKRGITASKITVLPIRPELETFLAVNHTYRETPPFTFLFIGRLAPEKNIPRIIRAFSLVHAWHHDAQLRIVGEGSEREHIERLIATYGLASSVTLLPWTADVPDEMNKADIFLLASLHEAYALTLVEAMAVGLPLITTDVGCVGEVVQDGVHGIVVHEDTDTAYAKAMERMITDNTFRTTCGTQGKVDARQSALQSGDAYARAWVTSIKG
jgi:glycosyltransferase involved in cell wall biosynthesis